MARSPLRFPRPTGGVWSQWATNFLQAIQPEIERCQKTDEEYEPPSAPGAASRIVLRDTNGVRYAVTVSTLGAITVTAL